MMRKILWLPLLTAVCGFTSLHADLTIVQQIHAKGYTEDAVTMLKADRMRVDERSTFKAGHHRAVSSAEPSEIMNRKSGELIRMKPTRRIYLKEALSDYIKTPPGMPKDAGITLTPAGKRETISGYVADEYTGAASSMKITLWVTKAIPDCANIVKQMSGAFSEGPMMGLLKSMGMGMREGFPVRAVYQSASGDAATFTVRSISAKPIADSEFEVPTNYRQVDHIIDLELGGPLATRAPGGCCLP